MKAKASKNGNVKAIETLLADQYRELTEVFELLRHERLMSAHIHETLLSSEVPANLKGCRIGFSATPARDIRGDFLAFFQPTFDVTDVVIGDVMGKGLPAAFVANTVKAQLHHLAEPVNTAMSCAHHGPWRQDLLSVERILNKVQDALVKPLIKLEFFVTLFYARLDHTAQRMQYIDCGSPKPLHYRPGKGVLSTLQGNNFPLGMVNRDTYRTEEVSFLPGDSFIFYSDGVTEAQNTNKEPFGVDRLRNLIAAQHEKPPQRIVDLIRDAVTEFTGSPQFDDDFTAVVVHIGDKPINEGETTTAFPCHLAALPDLRRCIKDACHTAGCPIEVSERLQLAINEIFCNIVKHGYDGGPGDNILVTFKNLRDGVAFEIADQGRSFDPKMIHEPVIGQETGMGMMMVKTISDEVRYSPKSNGNAWNRLRIYKNTEASEDNMVLSHCTQGNILVVTVKREHLDASGAASFKDTVIGLAGSENSQHIVLDLGHLQFIDSSGLGCLLSILRFLQGRHGDLKIANMTKPVRATFEMVRMHKLFEIFNTTEEAVSSFGTS